MCSTSWRASAIFGARGSSCTPASSNKVSALVSLPKVSCARFAASSGIPFFLRFAWALASRSSVSAAKPTQNGPFGSAATSARMSGFGSRSRLRWPLPRLILCDFGSAGGPAPPPAHGENQAAPLRPRHAALVHLARRDHVDALHPGGRLQRGRARNERHLRPRLQRRPPPPAP